MTDTVTEYFGSRRQATKVPLTPDQLAAKFAPMEKLFRPGIELKSLKPQVRIASIVSEMIGWATKNEKNGTLTSDEKEVRSFILGYTNLLTDLSDHLLSYGEIKDKKGNLNQDILLNFARFNQRLALALYQVGLPTASNEDKNNAGFFISVLQESAKKGLPVYSELLKAVKGALAQAGVMRLLYDQGYEIILPDYNNLDELRVWDLEGGVDLVAISPLGRTYFIDVKGEFVRGVGISDTAVEFGETRHIAEIQLPGSRPNHKEIFKQVVAKRQQSPKLNKWKGNITKPKPLTVIIPTGPDYLGVEGIKDQRIAQDTLEKIGKIGGHQYAKAA